jgi:uncharacterized membrane protein YphA (DoxX/SURF4 family)
MNTALWIVAGFLTALYLLSGFGKLFTPQEKMAKMMRASEWVLDFSPGALKAIGAAEILGAIGLILPALLDIAPVLVPQAALGLVLLMTGAVIMRIRRHEVRYALLDLTYLALAAFVAFGRFGPESFTS